MKTFVRSLYPALAFLAFYLPAGVFSLTVTRWAGVHAPALAPAVQLFLGALAFALAVVAAAECCLLRGYAGPLIQRLLHLRRDRMRLALLFAILGAVPAGAADLYGASMALGAGPGRIGVAVVLLYPLAWLILGAICARGDLMRRALGEAVGRS
jgi:hypothetical protein